MDGKVIGLKKIGTLNPNKEELTVEKLKTFKGLENLKDEEAQETVFAIQTLASIIYEFANEQARNKNIDESENENQQLKIAA
jgi:hypothetical protein